MINENLQENKYVYIYITYECNCIEEDIFDISKNIVDSKSFKFLFLQM